VICFYLYFALVCVTVLLSFYKLFGFMGLEVVLMLKRLQINLPISTMKDGLVMDMVVVHNELSLFHHFFVFYPIYVLPCFRYILRELPGSDGDGIYLFT